MNVFVCVCNGDLPFGGPRTCYYVPAMTPRCVWFVLSVYAWVFVCVCKEEMVTSNNLQISNNVRKIALQGTSYNVAVPGGFLGR